MEKSSKAEEMAKKAAESINKASEEIAKQDVIVLRHIAECTLELLSSGETITTDSLLAYMQQKDYSDSGRMMQVTNETAQKLLLERVSKNT